MQISGRKEVRDAVVISILTTIATELMTAGVTAAKNAYAKRAQAKRKKKKVQTKK